MKDRQKIALVTGASSGIGEALARELVSRGWQVIGIARSADKLAKLHKELPEAFIPIVCDISKVENITRTSEQLRDKQLCPSLFFLNAGITGDQMIEHENHIDLNLHQQFLQTGYFGALGWVIFWEPVCRGNGGANFVLTSSLNAVLAVPNRAGYCAAKAAISKAFECLSMTYDNTLNRFSIVYPGPTKTPGIRGSYPFTEDRESLARKMIDFAQSKRRRLIPSKFYHYIALPALKLMPEKWVVKIFNSMQRT
ncbi:MAG: SDR family oxidoreductase [Verrucomicrobia bacterium]|nr:SDR family oxidoreductase [Verrucomicrobiota bacterium]